MSVTLSEARSKSFLADHGVPFVEDRLVSDPTEAAAAATELGFPVVAKLCGDAIAHKTERGLVRLGLPDAAAVEEAATDLLARALPEDGTVGILVAPMVRGAREMIAGLSRDPQFGMTVMIGFGGILAEAVADVAIRLVPVTRLEAAEMLDDLRTRTLLGPFRGEPEVDREALVRTVLALSHAAEAHPELVAVDLNPLVVCDGVPVAVDALVELDVEGEG